MYRSWLKYIYKERLIGFYLSVALSLTWIFIPFIWIYLTSINYSSFEVFMFNLVFCITAILGEIPFGIFADRFSRRFSIQLGCLLITLGNLFFITSQRTVTIIFANLSLALGMTAISGADSAYLYDYLKTKNRVELYPIGESFLSITKYLCIILGYILSSLIVLLSSDIFKIFIGSFLISSISFLVSFTIPKDMLRSKLKTEQKPLKLKHPLFIYIMLYSMVMFPLLRAGIYFDQAYILFLGFPIYILGIVFALKTSFSFLIAPYVPILLEKLNKYKLFFLLTLSVSISFMFLLLSKSLSLIILVLSGILFGIYSPSVKIVLNSNITDSKVRATIMSIESMSRRIGFALLSPIIGKFLDLSITWTISLFITLSLLLTIFTLVWLNRRSDTSDDYIFGFRSSKSNNTSTYLIGDWIRKR